VGRVAHGPAVREQPPHQRRGAQGRPDLVERPLPVAVGPEVGLELGPAGQLLAPAGGDLLADKADEPGAQRGPPDVVGDVTGDDLIDGGVDIGGSEAHPSPGGREFERLVGSPSPGGGHRLGQHQRHAVVALEPLAGRVVGAPDAVGGAGQQPPERGLAHRGLPQRRQHLGDVAQEQRVGADDQHALAVELAAVLVEQERGPVQAHGGLAGARSALDDHAGGERGPDHLVLLGGDRGHDVAHLAGARPLELGQQGIGDAAVVGRVDAVGIVEDLVEQVVDAAVAHDEAAAAVQLHRVGGGGSVERRRHVGPPVDDDRVALGVLDVAAADVPGGAVLVVEPAEAEPGDVGVETVEAALQVPLGGGRVGRLGGRVGELGDACGAGPHRLETSVGVVDVVLFVGQVGMGHRSSSGRGVALRLPASGDR
jgi:hypothetical protein